MPEVGTLGFVKGDEVCEFRTRQSDQAGELPRGTLADFGSAFDADAKMAGIGRKFFLEGRGGRLMRISLGHEEKLQQLRTHEIDRGGAKRRAFEKIAEKESVFRRSKRKDEATTSRGRGKSAKVEPRDDAQRAE